MGNKKSKYRTGHPDTCGDRDEKIIGLRVRSCRIFHGSISWMLTGLKLGMFDPLEHWWIEIKTDRSYYCVQQYQCGSQEMMSRTSWWECTKVGLDCAKKPYDSTVWTEGEMEEAEMDYLNLGHVITFIDEEYFEFYYNKITHNCQDFCKLLYGCLVKTNDHLREMDDNDNDDDDDEE